MLVRKNIISFYGLLTLVCFINLGKAQFTYHTDANSNSFTLKTPSLQQSFSRFYGVAQQQPQQQQLQEPPQIQQQQQLQQPQQIQQQQQLQQAQQIQQQQQLQQAQQIQQQQQLQPQPQYQQQTLEPLQYSNVAGNSPQYQQYQPLQQFATTGPAAQDNAAYQQPTPASYAQNLQQFQQAQGQNAQQQYAQQLNAYYAQQQQQQQQQQHQHQQMYAQQQQHQLLKQLYSNSPTASPTTSSSEQPGSNHLFTAEQYASFMNAQHQKQQQQHQIYDDHKFYRPVTGAAPETISYNNTPQSTPINRTRTGPRNGLQYSSADKVSHVKYQSGNLAYDF